MAWEDYANMRLKSRKKLLQKAVKGDREAQASLYSYTRQIASEVNKRLRELEKGGYDYGKSYNYLMNYLNTQLETNRMVQPWNLNGDYESMYWELEHAIPFLESKVTTRKGAKESELKRLATLQEYGILPENTSYRQSRNFLKFLGNEEFSDTIEMYGNSEKIIDMLYDAYKKKGKKGMEILKTAFTEFLAGRITFDTAMERVGIKVEDYNNKKYSMPNL